MCIETKGCPRDLLKWHVSIQVTKHIIGDDRRIPIENRFTLVAASAGRVQRFTVGSCSDQ